MKYNKFLLAIILSMAMQPNMSFGMEDQLAHEKAQMEAPQSQSYWQQYAPQRLQDLRSYVSQKVSSTYDAVSKWSTRKKLAVLTAIIGSLAAIYNREQIIGWVNNAIKEYKLESLMEEMVVQGLAYDKARKSGDQGAIFAEGTKLMNIFYRVEEFDKAYEISDEEIIRAADKVSVKHPVWPEKIMVKDSSKNS